MTDDGNGLFEAAQRVVGSQFNFTPNSAAHGSRVGQASECVQKPAEDEASV